jgi:hypothetical protein
MNPEDYIEEAIQAVSSWDLSEEHLDQAINDQCYLMAGQLPNHYYGNSPEFPESILQYE